MGTVRYPARRDSLSLSPWPEIGHLSNRLQRMLGEVADDASAESGWAWAPAMDIEETAEELVLRADLPGLEPDEVSIELENGVLTLSGERTARESRDDPNRRFHIFERRFGTFRRSISLPRTVNADEITAAFDRGVLTVRLPKVQEAKARKIEIRTHG